MLCIVIIRSKKNERIDCYTPAVSYKKYIRYYIKLSKPNLKVNKRIAEKGDSNEYTYKYII